MKVTQITYRATTPEALSEQDLRLDIHLWRAGTVIYSVPYPTLVGNAATLDGMVVTIPDVEADTIEIRTLHAYATGHKLIVNKKTIAIPRDPPGEDTWGEPHFFSLKVSPMLVFLGVGAVVGVLAWLTKKE